MKTEPKIVAILTSNEALSSILHMVLSERPELRIRAFQTEAELSLYMHIAPVDLLICDFDPSQDDVTSIVPALREKAASVRPNFQVIALARKVNAFTRTACVRAGIDEVIVKPMSPMYLEERVLSRLREGPRHISTPSYAGADRRQRPAPRSAPSDRFARPESNVVPLFGTRSLSGYPLN